MVKEVSKSLKGDGKNIQPWYTVRATFFLSHSNKFDAATVDQPAGTGFSYTSTNSYVHNLQQASLFFFLLSARDTHAMDL